MQRKVTFNLRLVIIYSYHTTPRNILEERISQDTFTRRASPIRQRLGCVASVGARIMGPVDYFHD
jgi:hypothetical protein